MTILSSSIVHKGVRKRMKKYIQDRRLKKKEFIFVHIPRTGGGSFGAMIQDKPDHVSALMMRDVLGEDAFANLLTFSLVRNTWDRLVSVYYWYKDDPALKNIGTFEDFVMSDNPAFAISQLFWLTDSEVSRDMSLLSNYRYCSKQRFGPIMVDNILSWAVPDQCQNFVRDVFFMQTSEACPKNVSNRDKDTHYSNQYTEAMVEMVQNRYADEIERFGFVFEDYRNMEEK